MGRTLSYGLRSRAIDHKTTGLQGFERLVNAFRTEPQSVNELLNLVISNPLFKTNEKEQKLSATQSGFTLFHEICISDAHTFTRLVTGNVFLTADRGQNSLKSTNS